MLSTEVYLKIKKTLIIVGFNILLIVLIIAALEFGASLFASKPRLAVVDHHQLNHTWKPSSSYVHDEWIKRNPDYPEPYTHYYNQQAWLETYDVKKEKAENTYRIFYLGDSFTEGTCPMDQSVPSQLELKLNELAEGIETRFEVINTGTSSYSPTLMYILLRHVLLDYSPDMVVIQVDMSDNFDDFKYAQTLIRDEAGNPWACPLRGLYDPTFIDTEYGAVTPTLRLKLQLWLYTHSYTYNLLLKMREGKPAGPTSETLMTLSETPAEELLINRWAWCEWEWGEDTETLVLNTLDIIYRIGLLCEQYDIKLMITSVPHYRQYAGNTDGTGPPMWSTRPHVEISRVAQQLQVPYLHSFNLMAPSIIGSAQSDYYYDGNMHFNPRGYKLWSDIHIDFILNENTQLLPASFYEHLGKIRTDIENQDEN